MRTNATRVIVRITVHNGVVCGTHVFANTHFQTNSPTLMPSKITGYMVSVNHSQNYTVQLNHVIPKFNPVCNVVTSQFVHSCFIYYRFVYSSFVYCCFIYSTFLLLFASICSIVIKFGFTKVVHAFVEVLGVFLHRTSTDII